MLNDEPSSHRALSTPVLSRPCPCIRPAHCERLSRTRSASRKATNIFWARGRHRQSQHREHICCKLQVVSEQEHNGSHPHRTFLLHAWRPRRGPQRQNSWHCQPKLAPIPRHSHCTMGLFRPFLPQSQHSINNRSMAQAGCNEELMRNFKLCRNVCHPSQTPHHGSHHRLQGPHLHQLHPGLQTTIPLIQEACRPELYVTQDALHSHRTQLTRSRGQVRPTWIWRTRRSCRRFESLANIAAAITAKEQNNATSTTNGSSKLAAALQSITAGMANIQAQLNDNNESQMPMAAAVQQ